jgi:hypothetical protein
MDFASGVALVVSLASLLVAVRADRRAAEAHRWQEREHQEKAERQRYCERIREQLKQDEHVDIGPDEILWAKWGHEQRFFLLVETFDGAYVIPR